MHWPKVYQEIEVDIEAVLDEISTKDIVNYLGIDTFLDEIGESAAIAYLGIEVAE